MASPHGPVAAGAAPPLETTSKRRLPAKAYDQHCSGVADVMDYVDYGNPQYL